MNSAAVNWDAMLAESRPRVYSYIYSRIRHPQDAEDLAQQVLLKAYRSRDRFDPAKSAPATWIYNITRTAVIDYYRTRKTHGSLDAIEGIDNLLTDGENTPELALLSNENQEALANALCRLPEQERDLIILHYSEEASLAEIARMMNLPYGRIKRLHAKALAQLKLLLSQII